MSVFDRYLEQAKDFARKLVRAETGTRRWATVTAVDPVRITYDGTTTQGIISPVVLGTPVTVGDRVRAHTIHDKTYITRANPEPVEAVFSGPDIFDSLESGVSVLGDSIALVEGRKALMTLSLLGVDRTSGNQRTEVGVLRQELWPVHAAGFSGYYTNGSAQFAVTGSGEMSIRWASGAASSQLFASTAWVLAEG